MKIVKLALLVVLLAGTAAAQGSSSASIAPDLTVIKVSWHPVKPRNIKIDPPQFFETGMPREMRPLYGNIYEFTVKNTGSKAIKYLLWEHSFTDPATQKRFGRRQYKSSVKILPGMTAKLVAYFLLPPPGTIDVKQAGQDLQELPTAQVVIQRIKYADGSVWERASRQP
jgi:hypothetical protein